jgi:hypothetical protein
VILTYGHFVAIACLTECLGAPSETPPNQASSDVAGAGYSIQSKGAYSPRLQKLVAQLASSAAQ